VEDSTRAISCVERPLPSDARGFFTGITHASVPVPQDPVHPMIIWELRTCSHKDLILSVELGVLVRHWRCLVWLDLIAFLSPQVAWSYIFGLLTFFVSWCPRIPDLCV
jgi:hypothetical protein